MNNVVRTAIISEEPISLSTMKNWLRVPQGVVNDDTEITDLITEVREAGELLSNCALVRSNFVQYLDHFPGHTPRDGRGGTGAGYGYGTAGWGWNGGHYNRHHRPHNEIKVKMPPLVKVMPITYIGTDGIARTLNPGQDFIVDVASQPGRIRPIPYQPWPLTLDVPAAVAIPFLAGYAPNSDNAGGETIAEPETEQSASNPPWAPTTNYQQYSYLVDPNGCVEVQLNAGNPQSGPGPAAPAWPVPGGQIADGGCLWQNYGPIVGTWAPDTQYTSPCVLVDFNSNLQALNVAQLTSQSVPPYTLQSINEPPLPWQEAAGGLTTDNNVAGAWRCLGEYIGQGNQGLTVPNSPEQQISFTIDRTLPKIVTRFMKALGYHWYYNREPVTPDNPRKVPFHIEQMLATIAVYDFAPTP